MEGMGWNCIRCECLSRDEEKNWTSNKTKKMSKLGRSRWIISWCSQNSRAWTPGVGARVRVHEGVFGKPVDFGVWHTGSPSGPGGPLSPKSPGKPWGHRESSFNAPLQSRYRKTHHQVQRTSAIFASQHLANHTRLTCFHLAPPTPTL